MDMIANEGGLLSRPLRGAVSFLISMAERYEMVIDFSKFPNLAAGTKLYLENRLPQSNGRKPDDGLLPQGSGNKLLELHRRHLGTPMRDARREVSLYRGALPGATSAALAAQLLGHQTRPSEAAVRAEAKIRLQEALNGMDPLDREVLALRHFEHLTNAEAAQVLQIKEAAAGKRYLRALERLREILAQLPGGMELC